MMRNYNLTIIRTNNQYFDTKIEKEGSIIMKEKMRVDKCEAFACVIYIHKWRDENDKVQGNGKTYWQYMMLRSE